MKSKPKLVYVLLIPGLLLILVACMSQQEPSPLANFIATSPPTAIDTPSSTRTQTATPSQISTIVITPTSSLTPSLMPLLSTTPHCIVPGEEGAWFILHNDVFGHPGPDAEELDRALAEVVPDWVTFRQELDWRAEPVSAGQVVDDASFADTFQLNSAVTLVTVGLLLDWRLPSDGDLFVRSRSVGEKLEALFWDYVFDENDVQARYPEVANPATYAIYAYFDYDQTVLEMWCEAYLHLFGQSPLYVP